MPRQLPVVLAAVLLFAPVRGLAAEPKVPQAFATASAIQGAFLTELTRLSSAAGGVVGVTLIHLESGRTLSLNGDLRFPMASTFKIAVAGAVLSQVDAGALKLDQMVEVPTDMLVESDVIADRFIHPGVSLSVANLLELMLTESDNTATDVLVKLSGGPAAANAWLARLGVRDQHVDRDTSGLLRDFFDMGPGPYLPAARRAAAARPGLWRTASSLNAAYDDDVRDTSTPEAMGQMLAAIYRGQGLSPSSRDLLIQIMQRCRTGEARLKALLPEGTVLAHKTGTLGATVNDVGVMTLPNGKGRLVIAVMIKKSPKETEVRERVIAEIARAAHDYFTFVAQ